MPRARPICQHADRAPVPAVLETFARFWAEERTGFLRWRGGEARLVQGEPPTGEDLQALVHGLYQDDPPEHLEAHVPLEKTAGFLANELWFAARKAASRRVLKGRSRDCLVPGPAGQWGGKLPLRYATKKVVERVMREEMQLRATMEIPREVRREVLDEICALLLMGVLRLQGAVAPAVDSGDLGRLRDAWARVQSSDDWSVFELRPSDDEAVIESAIARQIGHFQAFDVDPRLAGDGQDLARRIIKRLEFAAEGIRGGSALGPADDVSAEDGYAAGMRRLKAEVYGEAVKCFAKANKRFPGQPRNAAWMAYAIYKDASRPEADRKMQAVQLAEKISRVDRKGDALYVLARIAYDGGDHLDAWTILGRLISLNPKHRRGRRLHDHVSSVLGGESD